MSGTRGRELNIKVGFDEEGRFTGVVDDGSKVTMVETPDPVSTDVSSEVRNTQVEVPRNLGRWPLDVERDTGGAGMCPPPPPPFQIVIEIDQTGAIIREVTRFPQDHVA